MMAEVPVARVRASLSVSIRVARRSDRRTLLRQRSTGSAGGGKMRDVFNHDTRDKAAKEEMAELRSGEEEAGRSEEEQICPLRQEEEQMRALSDENLAKKRAVKRELVLARRESARLREEHAAAELRVQEQTSDVRAVLRVYSGEANAPPEARNPKTLNLKTLNPKPYV